MIIQLILIQIYTRLSVRRPPVRWISHYCFSSVQVQQRQIFARTLFELKTISLPKRCFSYLEYCFYSLAAYFVFIPPTSVVFGEMSRVKLKAAPTPDKYS